MRAPLFLAIGVVALAACATASPPGGSGAGFEPAQLVKTDIDRVADAYHREIVASLRLLAEKFYRRNPREWKKGGAADVDAAVARIFDQGANWRFPEFGGRFGTDAMALAFREDYRGDRVLALIGGLGGMIHSAFNDKAEFFLTDELEPQKFYNSARNVEIVLWRLSHNRDATGALFLLANEAGMQQNLSFEREFGKIIGHLDLLSKIAADKTNRTIVKVLHSLASAVFLPRGRDPMKSLVILISGRGSNLAALLDAKLPGRVAAVISNRREAAGLLLAQARGVKTVVLDHREFRTRADFDRALGDEIERHGVTPGRGPDLVVLAGFMRILGEPFVSRFDRRLVNIHPSLLPSFPGLATHAQALAAGVKVHGCSVHFVTNALDNGPIIIQAAVPVTSDDNEDSLAARVLEQEHKVYPLAVRWFLEGRLALTPKGRVILEGEGPRPAAMIAPAG